MRIVRTFPMKGGSKTVQIQENAGAPKNISCFFDKGRVECAIEYRDDGLTVIPRSHVPTEVLLALEA